MATSSAVTQEGRMEHGCLDNADAAIAAPLMGEEGEGERVSSQAELVAQNDLIKAERCADVDRARGEPESLSSSPIRNTTSAQPPEKVASPTDGDAIPSDDATLEGKGGGAIPSDATLEGKKDGGAIPSDATLEGLKGGGIIPSDATLEGSSASSGEGSKPSIPSTEVVAAMSKLTAEVIISTNVELPTGQRAAAAAEEADEEVSVKEELRANQSGLGQPANGTTQEKQEVGAIYLSRPACEVGELRPPVVDPVNDEGGYDAPSIAMDMGAIGEQGKENVDEVIELPSPREVRTGVSSSVHTESPSVEKIAVCTSSGEGEEDVSEGSLVEERPPSPPLPPLLCSTLSLTSAGATSGDCSFCQLHEGDKLASTSTTNVTEGSVEDTTDGRSNNESKEVCGDEIDGSSLAESGVGMHALNPRKEAESVLQERVGTSGSKSSASTDGNISGDGGDGGDGGDPPPLKSDESANANETSMAPALMSSSGDEKSEERKIEGSVNGGEEGSTSPLLLEEDEKGVNELDEREQAEDGGYAGDVDGTLSRSRHLADVNGTTVEEDDGEDARNDLNSSGDESGGSSEWSSGAEWEDENGDFNDDSGDELGLKSSSKGKKAKKKKKKKKKKKSRDVDGGCLQSSCSDDLSLPSEIADLRYNSALEELKTEKSCLWVQLSRCRIGDKKVKRLSDALRGNTTVTSIDLSDNKITDDGIKVLAGVLAGGSASDLINIDVRGNHLSNAGLAALKSLQGLRKLVKVEYGESMSRKYEDSSENGNGDLSTAGGKENRANGWVDDAHERLLASSAEGWADETVREGLPRPVPSLNEWAAVEQVEGALKAVADSAECLNVGHLTAQITNVLHMIDQELREAPTRCIFLDKSPRGLALTTANIEKFVSVLDMSPPPRLMQNKEVMPTAGRHRIVVIDLLSRLVMYCSQEIDQKIVLSGAVRKVVDLMFSHPLCSILHGQVSHFLEAVLTRPNSSLCSHALEGADGLPSQLAKAGRECVAMPIGKRPGYCGHVVVLCTALENLAHINSNVRSILEKNEDWFRLTSPSGALGKLVKEQCGALGGPRPQFPMSCLFDGGSAQAAVDHLRALFLG